MCVVLEKAPGLTETFIQAHLNCLPARVTVATGYIAAIEGRPTLSTSTPARCGRKIARTLRRRPYIAETTLSYMRAFRASRAEVVLAEYGSAGVHVAEACRLADVPLVVHFHGYDASMNETLQQLGDDYRRMFAAAAAVIVVSEAMRRQLASLGCPAEKLRLNHYGVDIERVAIGSPAKAPPVFLAVGRFTDKKAPQLTLLAFERVLAQVPQARLRMIGEGPLLGPCRDLAKSLGIMEAVRFDGALPHEQVLEAMQEARAFVQHSITASSGDSEGTPVAIIEAGASGLPVAATFHAGIPEVVIDGETGFLVREHDIGAMAERMIELVENPPFAEQLGQAARRRVEEHFTMDRSIAGLAEILEVAINEHGSTGRRDAPG